MELSHLLEILPKINASLNLASFCTLILGFISIKKGHKDTHIKLMVCSFIISSLFLACYLFYHYHVGSKPFPHQGVIRTVYYFILVPHIILATLMLPPIFMTFNYARIKNWEKHKFWARLTLPVWLYVSLSGVLVYIFLYEL